MGQMKDFVMNFKLDELADRLEKAIESKNNYLSIELEETSEDILSLTNEQLWNMIVENF